MKKLFSLLLITAIVFSLCSCAGKGEKVTETASSEITGAPASTSAAPENLNEVIEDVSAYPVWYLGKRLSEAGNIRCGSSTIINGQPNCEFLGEDGSSVFPGVNCIFSEGAYDSEGLQPRPDALFKSVYTSGETELYPDLTTGKSYNEYKQSFAVSELTYSEDYCCFYATSLFIVNGRDVTAYLFFYDKISLCSTILMTVADELDFTTISVPEYERELYPVFYIGRNALSMKAKYGGDLYFVDDFDTDERKTALLMKPAEQLESKKVSETAKIKNVHISLPGTATVPGLKMNDSLEDYFTAFRKFGESPELSADGDNAYLGTLFIAGYFVECYAITETAPETGADTDNAVKIISVSFNCKQLFD